MLIGFLAFFVLLSILLAFFLYRFIKKVFQLDELIELFQDDINTNVNFLSGLLKKDLFMNTPEIIDLHKKMEIMQMRLREYIIRMNEETGR